LTPDIFSSLSDPTLEAWVLWTGFDGWLNKQIFSCGPAAQDVWLSNLQDGAPHLAFANPAGRQLTAGRQDLPLNRWHHIAAVSGSKGMRLYLNGVLLGTNAATGSFKEAGATGPARLGQGTNLEASTGPSFHGKIAEFRVWRTMRSDQEIQENMFKKLTGTEDGLFGLWNFAEGTARDLSTNGYHGTLKGNAKILAQRWPEPSEVIAPAIVHARVTDEAGAALPFFQVHVLQEGVLTLSFTNITITTNLQFCVYPKGGAHKFVVQSGNKRDTVIVPEVKPAQRLDLNFVLSDAASLAGTLRMFDGTPHVAVPVQALDASNRVVATVLTDEQGNYRIEKIKAGSYLLPAMRDGYEYFVEPNKSIFVLADENLKSRIANFKSLTAPPGETLEKLDFRFAPFKKGTWKLFTPADGFLADFNFCGTVAETNDFLWLGTARGLTRFDGKSVENFAIKMSSNPHVRAILKASDGSIWVGGQDGIARFANDRYQVYRLPDQGRDEIVRNIVEEKAGKLWVCTLNHLWEFDRDRNSRETNGYAELNIGNKPISFQAIEAGHDGILWIGTAHGLFRRRGNELAHYTSAEGLAGDLITSLRAARDGVLWCGTTNGLCRFEGGHFRVWTKKDGLADNRITAIEVGPDGVLWVGTAAGVSRFDGNTFVNFTEKDGVLGNVVGLCSAPDGALWILGSGTGLARYDEETFVEFGVPDGFPAALFRAGQLGSVILDSDGTLWCASRGVQGSIFRFDGRRVTDWAAGVGLPRGPYRLIGRDPTGRFWILVPQQGLPNNF